MCNMNSRREPALSVLLLLFLLMAPVISFGEGVGKKSADQSTPKADYLLIIEDNLISVSAENALLKPIIEEIGRRMGIEVVADIPPEQTVTASFERLPIEEAIKKLSANSVLITASETELGKITKITLLPKGKEQETKAGEESPKTPNIESFKFEFNPATAPQEEK